MSSDETLYSRQNSKEIDEALAWLESLGESAATRRSTRTAAEPTAFMRLPAWLKQDIRVELPEPVAPVTPSQSDNLSWLDAIASGSGGVSEEPPTMQWAESVVEPVPNDDKTEIMLPSEADYGLDAPTQVSMKRPAVVDDELTTTIVPSSDVNVADEFEPTSIITDLSDDALSLLDTPSGTEPTSLIMPESFDDDFSFDDLFDEPTRLIGDDSDAEPTSLILPESRQQSPEEPTQLIHDDAALEPLNLILPDAEELIADEPTQLIGHSADLDATNLILPESESQDTAELLELIDDHPDLDATNLILPEPQALKEPMRSLSEAEPTHVSMRDAGQPIDGEPVQLDADVEPTSIIVPEMAEQALDEPTRMISDDPDLEPTNLILPEERSQAAIAEPTHVSLPSLPVEQEPSEPEAIVRAESTNFIEPAETPADMAVVDEDLEPTNLILPEERSQAAIAEPTHVSFPSLPVEQEPSEPEATIGAESTNFIEPAETPVDEAIVDEDLQPTYLLAPEEKQVEPENELTELSSFFAGDEHEASQVPDTLDAIEALASEVASETSADSDTLPPIVQHPNDFEPTEIVLPDANLASEIDDRLTAVERDAPQPNDFEPTQLLIPDATPDADLEDDAASIEPIFPDINTIEPTELYFPADDELNALFDVEGTSAPTELIAPGMDLFDDIPAELLFDDYAALAEQVVQTTPSDRTEIIPPTAELPTDTTELIAPGEIPTAESGIEQSIEGLSNYVDEPTEPSLVRPKLDEFGDEATQFISPTNGRNNLFEPTIVSEISIAERWQAIPTDFRPREPEFDRPTPDVQTEAKPPTQHPTQYPTETINEVLHIADDIPDDPDETIAWLEEMARRQKMGISAESVIPEPVDEVPFVPEAEAVDETQDELPTILAEPGQSAERAGILDEATNEHLPSDFFDSISRDAPTIMADVGESGDDKIGEFMREVNEVLEDDRPPLETLNVNADPTAESEEELTDALAWLEELVAGTDMPVDEMTIELNETDVNRLLDSYRPSEFNEPTPDISEHPTLITHHPEVREPDTPIADEPPDELDAALSWLEGLNFDDESSLIEPPPIIQTDAPITLIDYSAARNSAQHAFETKSYAEAIIIFEDLLQREDPNATALVIDDLVSWTGKVQDHAPFYRLLGDAYLQRGDYEKAAWTFRRGLTI